MNTTLITTEQDIIGDGLVSESVLLSRISKIHETFQPVFQLPYTEASTDLLNLVHTYFEMFDADINKVDIASTTEDFIKVIHPDGKEAIAKNEDGKETKIFNNLTINLLRIAYFLECEELVTFCLKLVESEYSLKSNQTRADKITRIVATGMFISNEPIESDYLIIRPGNGVNFRFEKKYALKCDLLKDLMNVKFTDSKYLIDIDDRHANRQNMKQIENLLQNPAVVEDANVLKELTDKGVIHLIDILQFSKITDKIVGQYKQTTTTIEERIFDLIKTKNIFVRLDKPELPFGQFNMMLHDSFVMKKACALTCTSVKNMIEDMGDGSEVYIVHNHGSIKNLTIIQEHFDMIFEDGSFMITANMTETELKEWEEKESDNPDMDPKHLEFIKKYFDFTPGQQRNIEHALYGIYMLVGYLEYTPLLRLIARFIASKITHVIESLTDEERDKGITPELKLRELFNFPDDMTEYDIEELNKELMPSTKQIEKEMGIHDSDDEDEFNEFDKEFDFDD